MPKNTGPGGKKFKKIKHNLELGKRPMIYAEEGQKYALVTKLLGNGRIYVSFIRDKVGQVELLAIIRGSLRKKKQWVKVGNYILISERDYEKEKVDVIHVYNDGEMNELKKKGLISESLVNLKVSNEDDEFNDFIDMNDEPELDKKEKRYQKTEKGGSIVKQDYGIVSESESESETDSDSDNESDNKTENKN